MRLRVMTAPKYDVTVEREGDSIVMRQRGLSRPGGEADDDVVVVPIDLVQQVCATLFEPPSFVSYRVGGVEVAVMAEFVRINHDGDADQGIEVLRDHLDLFVIGLLSFVGESHEHHS